MFTQAQRLAQTVQLPAIKERMMNEAFGAIEYEPTPVPEPNLPQTYNVVDIVSGMPLSQLIHHNAKNTPLAAGDSPRKVVTKSAIELKAPHLLQKITILWGTPMLHEFLSSVTMMDRPDRQGFDPEVASELFTLFMLNRDIANIQDEVERFR